MALEWKYRDTNDPRIPGAVIPDGSLHAVMGPAVVNGDQESVVVVLQNTSATKTVSSVVLWLEQDSAGGSVAIALGDDGNRTPGDLGVNIGGNPGTYSAPATEATGLSIGTLAPTQFRGIWVRRTLTSATPAYPELNRLRVTGTEPI